MTSILASNIPIKNAEKCGDTIEINCDEKAKDTVSTDYSVVYPSDANKKLPISGGAVVKISVSELPFSVNQNVLELLKKNIEQLSSATLKDGLSGLVDARIIINTIIHDVGISGALSSFPQITLCGSSAEDSNLESNKINWAINNICSLKFIPIEILEEISFALGQFQQYGMTGYKLSEFSNISTEKMALAATLEFLPFYNISEKNIVKKRGDVPIGGYFTVYNDNAYIKIPDLTGRDSAGFDPDLWSEEENRKLYIEVINKISLTRIPILEVDAPPATTLGEYDGEFSDTESVEIEIQTDSDIDTVYLSLILDNISTPPIAGLNVYSDSLELSTVPLLTKPLPYIFLGIYGSYNYKDEEFKSEIISKYFDEEDDVSLDNDGYNGVYGKLISDTDTPIDYIYGEQNRPEIILGNTKTGRSNSKNNSKYKNEKMTMARPIFAQTRPKIYDDVPLTWLKGSFNKNTGIATFSATEMSYVTYRPNISFSLYARKGVHIVRVPGGNIRLNRAKPSIDKINPNGFLGSDAIDSNTSISINGENLKRVNEVVLYNGDNTYQFVKSTLYPNLKLNSTESIISLIFSDEAYNNIPQNVTYDMSVRFQTGEESNKLPIYIGDKANAPSYPNNIFAGFVDNEFIFNGTGNPESIPLLSDGQSATIKIKSENRLFSGKYPIYAYLALDNSYKSKMEKFELNIKTLESENIVIASGMEYKLEQSPENDFYIVSKKKANLRFPGSAYYQYNLSSLIGIKDAYILFLNDSIKNISKGSDNISLSSDKYSLMKIGGSSSAPAFIAPGHITQVIAKVGDGSMSMSNDYSNIAGLSDEFDNIQVGPINVYQTIPKLGIVFSGADMPFMRKRHDILLNGKSIKSKLSDSISLIGEGSDVIAILKNVNSKDEGYLNLGIKVQDKRYNVTYDSSVVYGTMSSSLQNADYSINDEEDLELLTTLFDFNTANNLAGSYMIADDDSAVDVFQNLISSYGGGIIVSDPSNSISEFQNPISITSWQGDLTLSGTITGKTSFEDFKINTFTTKSDITSIYKGFLSVNSGSIYKRGQYTLKSDESRALAFNRVKVSDGAAIGFNIPKILGFALDRAGLSDEVIPTSIPINAGNAVFVRVQNVKRNFSIKVGSAVVKAINPTSVAGRKHTFDAQFIVPSSLIGVITSDDCIVICASNSNADRLKAKRILGQGFVNNIEDKMQELLFGLAGKIPNIDDLKALLCEVPLRFVNVDLCDVSIPTELINNFCDLSFHLLADLKLALNGFQILMVPIQVIFCIIDVLCSLLNPIKTARAMIRLFECLYDLVLLLPQISVPVMFLKLILHLLELLECLIGKILTTIQAINAIILGIENAIKYKDWASLKALEEILSEYLGGLNIDLDVLAPVISILAIFLQLLQLVFRFPCQVTPVDNAGGCNIDGTMLAGIVAGLAAPEEEFLPDWLIPVSQPYTSDSLEDAAISGSSTITYPVAGDIIATKDADDTYITSMAIDSDSLRATNTSLGFLASMGVSITKSKKGFRKPSSVEFQFKSKYEPSFFIGNKIIDPESPCDAPIMLTNENLDGGLKVANEKGNFISPIDGESFITKSYNYGTVKTLEQKIEVPIYAPNNQTRELVQIGVDTVFKTFDGIPKMAILDEEFNLYFIEDDGIEFNDDNKVHKIRARMVNNVSAPKFKFSRDEVDVDINGDGEITEEDIEAKVYEFPKIYFIDMRCAIDNINSMCDGAGLNALLLEEDNSDDVSDIIEQSKTCIEEFMATVKGFGTEIRDSINSGVVPKIIDVNKFSDATEKLKTCLGGSVDDICYYVMNSLNTSFKVEEDTDDTPLPNYIVPSIDSSELADLGYETNPPSITGASEYSEGDGDSAILNVGQIATLVVTPRDAMDLPLGGNLAEKISLEIVSDTTGDAEIIKNDNESIFVKNGDSYRAQVKSNKEGEVKLRARVCNRTIQSVTYTNLTSEVETVEVDCVDNINQENDSANEGGLVKVDRIITVYYIKNSVTRVSENIDNSSVAQSTPQAFGTSLEN